MTSPIGSNTSSVAAKASSVFGSARQAFKSMADAATARPEGADGPAVAETPAPAPVPNSRQGRTHDRYA